MVCLIVTNIFWQGSFQTVCFWRTNIQFLPGGLLLSESYHKLYKRLKKNSVFDQRFDPISAKVFVKHYLINKNQVYVIGRAVSVLSPVLLVSVSAVV